MTHPSSRAPRVSVIMPVRDGERYLLEAMTSILSQTMSDLELLVVDDGSVDASAEIARSTGDPRVRLLQGERRGEGAARNVGLDHARGRWIAWHDADDIALPHRLQSLLVAVENGADFAHSDMLFVDAAGQATGYLRSSAVPRDHVLPFLLREGTPFNNGSMMVRRAVVSELRFDESIRFGVDTDFVRRFAPDHHGVHVPEPLSLYRRHESSSDRSLDLEASFSHVRRLVEDEPLERLVPEAWREFDGRSATSVAAVVVGTSLFRRGFHDAALAWVERGLSGGPAADAATVIEAMVSLLQGDLDGVLRLLAAARVTAVSTCLAAEVHARSGDLVSANRLYSRALAADPQSYDAVAGMRATGEALGLRVVDDPRRRLLGIAER